MHPNVKGNQHAKLAKLYYKLGNMEDAIYSLKQGDAVFGLKIGSTEVTISQKADGDFSKTVKAFLENESAKLTKEILKESNG